MVHSTIRVSLGAALVVACAISAGTANATPVSATGAGEHPFSGLLPVLGLPTMYPAAASNQATANVTLSAVPQTVVVGQLVKVTAKVSPKAPYKDKRGKMTFLVDGVKRVTVDVGANGIATFEFTATKAGTHNVTAKFLGCNPCIWGTGKLPIKVTSPVPVTTTATLTLNGTNGTVTLNGKVVLSNGQQPVGICTFKQGTNVVGTAPVKPDGTCSVTLNGIAANADHAFTLVFDGQESDGSGDATAGPVPYRWNDTVVPGLTPVPDPQTITVDIPAGSLMISTPYTPESPLKLGTANLDMATSTFNASAVFDKVTVTDSRTGKLGWTASLERTNFVNGTNVIEAKHSGFHQVTPEYIPGNALNNITTNDIPAGTAATGPAAFAKAQPGTPAGSVNVKANFVLKDVPSSAAAGTYTATVIFTVV